MPPQVLVNSGAAQWLPGAPAEPRSEAAVLRFHQRLPDYRETALRPLPSVASELGLSSVLLKDESDRFGLPAFKILGASWCIYRVVGEVLGLGAEVADGALSLAELGGAARDAGLSLVTSTDGNCGRAVARMAAYLGIPARVLVPAFVDEATRAKIRAEGAEVLEVDGSYDDTLPLVVREARDHKVVMVLDVAFGDFQEPPKYFVQGYSTMLAESDRQVLLATNNRLPTHVIVPCGAGSISQAVTQHFKGAGKRTGLNTTSVIAVEPSMAASLRASLEAGKSVAISTEDTIMCGMNCGTLSTLAWPVLSSGIDASVVVSDQEAHAAVQELEREGVMAGPCGAATLAALRRLCTDAKSALGLGPESVVVLYCTEGARDYAVPS